MFSRLAAPAALVAVLVAASPARAGDRLTLDDAFARVAAFHPDLRLPALRGQARAAELDEAAQRPALRAGVEVENALGTGDYAGVDAAELTLSLASVLERGGKRDARIALAQGRIDALAPEREAARLDLLAETARRYLDVVGARHRRDLADADIAQRRRTVVAARQRFQAGASPESVVLTAQAALARAELDQRRATHMMDAARQHLAALWGEREPRFEPAADDALALPAIPDFDALATLLDRTPELVRFADERRIGEARLQLARSQAKADLDWQVGVRAFNDSDDAALVASVSMPLSGSRRAQPQIRAAQAELALLDIERESRGLSLYSTLVDAHGRYRVAQLEVLRLRDDILPALARAEAAAERAYRAGAISYLEWAQLQSERAALARQQLDTALDARRALIEIQRLTGEAFVQPAARTHTGASP
ncbi:TolC family protein [Lysobacter auxotrophicus]|uniref:TolC family protein n=1 Tax=Lysobacter auxotrophicus TaxID=2992573 RepID=A0ABM8D9M2_9GAMM|nr:TolC family protein [Lysobacter auxotrophicus]BDU15235.1 TolC family protein [Lysobacter auxotrophicus]